MPSETTPTTPAPPSNRWYDFLAWVEVHKQRLIIGAAAALVLLLIIIAWQWNSRRKELAASQAIVELRGTPAAAGAPGSIPRAEEFLKLAETYAGTAAAERAALLAAGRMFAEGRYSDARAQFEKFLQKYEDSQWGGQALYGVAASLEAEKRTEDAAAKYQQVITAYANEPIADQARIALGRLHESRQQPEQALKVYDEVMRTKMPGMWVLVARQNRERLLQEHPALAITNAPPAGRGTNLPVTLPVLTNLPAAPASTGAAKPSAP